MKKIALATVALGAVLLAGTAAENRIMEQGLAFPNKDREGFALIDGTGIGLHKFDPLGDTALPMAGIIQGNDGYAGLVLFDSNGKNPLTVDHETLTLLLKTVAQNAADIEAMKGPNFDA